MYVPFALCATGVILCLLAGCGKGEEPAKPPANAPVVYMNDPVFRKAVADKRKELQAIVSARAPLAKRMEELVREHGEDLAALQKISEWNDLHRRVVALNAKYEEVRRRQLRIVGDRLSGKDISK